MDQPKSYLAANAPGGPKPNPSESTSPNGSLLLSAVVGVVSACVVHAVGRRSSATITDEFGTTTVEMN